MAAGWNDFQLPRVSTHKLARRGEEVLERIARAGVTVPSDNRIARAVHAMDRLNDLCRSGRDVDPDDIERQQILIEAHRLLVESLMIVVARWERRTGPTTITNGHLSALLDGSDLPRTDFDHPRNLQFEAYVGASLALSGLNVRYAEPDFVIDYYRSELGIAAKRLTSRKPERLYDRLREATNQLRDADRQGYVAVNLDNWIDEPLRSEEPAEVGRQFVGELGAAYRELAKVSSRPALNGAMIFASWNVWDFSGSRSRFALRSAEQVVALTDDEQDVVKATSLFAPAKARLRNSMREIGRLVAVDGSA